MVGNKTPKQLAREAEEKAQTTWEAWEGCSLVPTGKKRRSGKPHTIMVVHVVVAMTESDAKALAKLEPRLKFVKRRGRPKATLRQGDPK